jgi:hypothetical protein
MGGKRLWRNRNHLNQAHLTKQQWRDRWDAARMFVTADGETGKAGGNETIRVDQTGQLRIKVPAVLAGELGSHVVISAPVRFAHRGVQWADRVAARRAVRYDISYDPGRGRWYLDASWTTSPEPGHSASRRGGRDRQTWTRLGDQASAAGPRSGQRTAAGTPPARPDHQPKTTRGCGSSGSPQSHQGRGSTGQHPPAAANTVRAATEQNSLLLPNQEL